MQTIPTFMKDMLWGEQLPQDLSGLDWNFVRYLREEALERFLKTGLPSQKEEDWHYTSLADVEKNQWRRVLSTANIQDTIPSLAGENNVARILFVDGYHSTAHTRLKRLPHGLRVTSLQEALQERNEKVRSFLQEAASDSWHDLNMALFDDGLLVEVDPGVKVDRPIEIVFLATEGQGPATYHARLMFDIGEGASLDVVEVRGARGSTGNSRHFGTSLTSNRLGANARMRKTMVMAGSPNAIRLIHEKTTLAEGASSELNLMHLGGGLMRHSVEILHAGEKSRSAVRAVNFADARHVDLLTTMQHEAAACESAQDIRALARAKGHAVFQGKIHVGTHAQKTNARQMHRGMLLSENAECDSKPGLEIYADDVQCTHGSTCGALDEQALFYMQSRGLSRIEAEKMLIEAFVLALFEEADMPARDAALALLRETVVGA